ncbi:VWA domain-containing protein [Candidatus Gracilibacteria bacterium]|nr:VWA domain-containing protein [Candidatus Gracilibacteria bacterium]
MTILGQFFKNPEFVALLLLVPVILYFELRRNKYGIKFKEIELLKEAFGGSIWIKYIKTFFKVLIFTLFVIIIANPGAYNITVEESKNGIDIALVLDISKSMLAEDVKPNRIEAAKKVIVNFIKKIGGDRLSMVIFAGKPFVSVPMTFDYNTLIQFIENIDTDSINQNIPGLSGTAIGDSLMQAYQSLESKIKGEEKREKVIILITDGEANVGIDPKTVTKYIKDKNIKVYSIGIGDPAGTDLYMTDQYGNKQYFMDNNGKPIKANLDEKTLKYISGETGGEYYLAKNETKLQEIFTKLASLNKSQIKTKTFKNFVYQIEKYLYLLIITIGIYMIFSFKYRIKL